MKRVDGNVRGRRAQVAPAWLALHCFLSRSYLKNEISTALVYHSAYCTCRRKHWASQCYKYSQGFLCILKAARFCFVKFPSCSSGTVQQEELLQASGEAAGKIRGVYIRGCKTRCSDEFIFRMPSFS